MDSDVNEVAVPQAVARLDSWLETMRSIGGYTGPVAHWWQNCLQFTGVGLDWRYEGIVIGYLNLYKNSEADRWLAKARRAGEDLVRGQLASGNFRNSCFELNPCTGGTPHEAACDLALLHVAEALRARGEPGWEVYSKTAERNLREYYISKLWHEKARVFYDRPGVPSFVPNKAATLTEALFKLSSLNGDDTLVEVYALPTLQAILSHQVQDRLLNGAIYQSSMDGRFAAEFFPYYTARCVPGLIAGFEWDGDHRYLEAAHRAMAFVLRWRYEDGSFPQVVYPSQRVNRYPQWIAAAGDILRAMALLKPYGLQADSQPTLNWLLREQEPTGAFRTAHGFGSQITQREPGDLPEFRDLLPVCGWNGQAFRYLTQELPTTVTEPRCADLWLRPSSAGKGPFEAECVLRGQRLRYREDAELIESRRNGVTLYRWRKGNPWAEVCAPEMMWK